MANARGGQLTTGPVESSTMSHHSHGSPHHDEDRDRVDVAILTISSSRTLAEDTAGDAIAAAVTDHGHAVAKRTLVEDGVEPVRSQVAAWAARADVDCIVSTGGTGVTRDDQTIEAVEPLVDKALPGFGELFRQLSFEEIGTRVVGTRAMAGIVDGAPVFCLPGSVDAVTLGVTEVVLPSIGHLTALASAHE